MNQTKRLLSPLAGFALVLVCCFSVSFAQTSSAPSPTETSPAQTSPVQTSPTQTSPTQTSPAQTSPTQTSTDSQASAEQALPSANSFDQVVDRAVEREHFFMAQMKQLHPLVETYMQNLKEDKDLDAPVPASDVYFLGRLEMSEDAGADDRAFISPTTAGLGKRMLSKLKDVYSMRFLPLGFAQMVILDQDFQRKNYTFTFVRREFLGEVRCIAIDVAPKKDAPSGRFLGRIWVEDQNYNIVRFNGTYYRSRAATAITCTLTVGGKISAPGIWLPTLIYSEESDVKSRLGQTLHYKAQTRLWGYNLKDLPPQLRVYRDHH